MKSLRGNCFLKILPYVTYFVGFQTMLILTLYGMAFHAMVVIGLTFDLLLKSNLSILWVVDDFKVWLIIEMGV